MDRIKALRMTPTFTEADRNMPKRDMIDNFSSLYEKSYADLPKTRDKAPWLIIT